MSINNIPEHFNRNYFKTALENGLNDKNIEISNLEFSMGSGVGENFLSSIYRVKVTYVSASENQPKTSFLIVKNVPPVSIFENLAYMHNKETVMYCKVLREIQMAPNGMRIAPKFYFSSVVQPQTMVLEDMAEHGYRLGNRQKGLDEDHCKLVLEKLGHFHAISMVYASKHPEVMNEFQEGTFTPGVVKTAAFEKIYGHNFKTALKEIQNWPGYENIVKKMTKLEPHFGDRLLESAANDKDVLKVINHGDMWINNILFKYDKNGKAVDVVLIDFQGTYYASPGIDLTFFLCTSSAPEILATQFDNMVNNYYYQSFKKTLQNMGYKPIPTLDEINREIRMKEFYGLASAIGLLPILAMESNESKDNSLDKLTSGEAQTNLDNIWSKPRIQQTMRFLLKRADNDGLLN